MIRPKSFSISSQKASIVNAIIYGYRDGMYTEMSSKTKGGDVASMITMTCEKK